jgi:hypothetical protein
MNKDLLNLKRPPSGLWAYLPRCFDLSRVKLKPLMVFAFLFSTAVLFAQERSVSGKVSDENGMGIPGVNILIRGTSNGTTSDAEGKYSISVSSGEDVLVFSFIGYTGQEIAVGTNSTIDVTLQPDITSLEEVIVTALGVKKESKKLGYARICNVASVIANQSCRFAGRWISLNIRWIEANKVPVNTKLIQCSAIQRCFWKENPTCKNHRMLGRGLI